ncbi:hypothetical protein [Amaricoccus macauensis]|uniref:hypothetical protein n=1 Tax=Amaricoccus macauensis TaxID=57001 RepID=UPI003C7CBEAD
MARPRRLPFYERAIYAIPVLGWMLKDVAYGDKDNIYYFIATLVMAWIIAIIAFGYPAIILPALALVPTIFIALLVITRG